MAELSDQEPSNISHIERGATKLSLPTIVNVANALGVSVDTLLCDSVEASADVYLREIDAMLTGCSHQDLKIITATIRSLKDALERARKETS